MKVLFAWLWSADHRGVATLILAVVVAVTGGAWQLFTYVHTKTPTPIDSRGSQENGLTGTPHEFRLCYGDDKTQCGPYTDLIGCTDPEDFARLHCAGRYDLSVIFETKGGTCGHKSLKLMCVPK